VATTTWQGATDLAFWADTLPGYTSVPAGGLGTLGNGLGREDLEWLQFRSPRRSFNGQLDDEP